jgi:hypothetical protein
MKGPDCEIVRDLLPERAVGSSPAEEGDPVEAHLRSCPDCQRELFLIQAVRSGRPEVPPELEARIHARIRGEFEEAADPSIDGVSSRSDAAQPVIGRRRWSPAWVLSAAAMVILALGTRLIWNQGDPEIVQDPIVVASQEPLPESWLWDDGIVAGAPVFDGLSDEDLQALLEELEG